jgi:hypothetical protein
LHPQNDYLPCSPPESSNLSQASVFSTKVLNFLAAFTASAYNVGLILP